MFRLFREMLKPARDYFRDDGYREWLRIKSACRNYPPHREITVDICGYRIKGSDASSLLHQYEEIFRNRSVDVSFDRNDPLIFCCGANIGLEIFRFKKKYPLARIVAFEADPQLARLLSENISANGLENVEVHAAAVWKENTTLPFLPDGALGGKTFSGTITVPAIRLADKLQQEETIDLLLMDIEGAETEVLPDCREQLRNVKRLFTEWHSAENKPQHLPVLLQLLSECGFRYRLNNKLPVAPFTNRLVENGFDAMVEIYAER